MIETGRNSEEPEELAAFREEHPGDPVELFGSEEFQPVKRRLKARLNREQGGLCAYCEEMLSPEDGQIDHVIPKGGPNGRPDLALRYDDWVHGCIHPRHCGQKRGDSLLPIEPGPDCNKDFELLDDGTIATRIGLDRHRRHCAQSTLDMLGLNFAALKQDRKRWISALREIGAQYPADCDAFLSDKPYRYILKTHSGCCDFSSEHSGVS